MIRTDQNINAPNQGAAAQDTQEDGDHSADMSDQEMNDAIYREISKAFEYILKYYDLHKRQIENLVYKNMN